MPKAKTDKTKATAAKPAPKKAPTKSAAKPAPKPPAKPAPKPPAKSARAPAKEDTAKPAAKAGTAKATGAKPAPKPAASASLREDNPLHKKLRLQPGDKGLVVAPPEADDDPLHPLPKSFSVLKKLDKLATSEGPFDYIHVFARDRTELAQAFKLLRERLSPGGNLWISWLTMSSKHRGGERGQATDLNDTVIRRIGLMNGMVDVKRATLDRDWAALLLVHRRR